MLLKGRLLRCGAAVHIAAVLRPLRSAIVSILELALVSPRLVASGTLHPAGAGLVRGGGLATGVAGVLGEGGAHLAWRSLGLGRVLPQAGVARLQGQRCGRGAAARRDGACRSRQVALRQPADGLACLWKGHVINMSNISRTGTFDPGRSIEPRNAHKRKRFISIK